MLSLGLLLCVRVIIWLCQEAGAYSMMADSLSRTWSLGSRLLGQAMVFVGGTLAVAVTGKVTVGWGFGYGHC